MTTHIPLVDSNKKDFMTEAAVRKSSSKAMTVTNRASKLSSKDLKEHPVEREESF